MGRRQGRQVKRSPPKILLALAVLTAACSSSTEAPPDLPGLSLSSSPAAQAAFRPLLRRWASAQSREERAQVGPDLEAFVARFRGDGKVPAAEALLAWIAIEKGDLIAGKRLSRGAANLGPGTWQDVSLLAGGAIKRRNGDAAGALAIFRPLLGTLIDPWARDLLNEEAIAAALGAGDPALAMKVMNVWLREADDEEQQLVRSRVERALAGMADADLIKLYDQRAAAAKAAEGEIDPLFVKRVAEIAIAAKDAVLAKKLLQRSGPLLGDRGDAVARLAAGAAAIRIDARTVGLLLSFRTAETRRRSAEVASGVAWGLELPGSGARLVVRDDGGDEERISGALTDLGRDGAAVIIAGIAAEDARAAASFAESRGVPVILIARPDEPAASSKRADSFVLPLGASPEAWPPRDEGPLGGWVATYGARPSFWAAAGRDAAVIAKRSVKDLPQAATEDAEEVASRRRAVRAALAQPGNDALWTVPQVTPAAP